MPMTIEEFGRTIKQKYPAYNDIPDRELGEKVLTKYPTYQDMITREEPKKAVDLLEGHGVLKGIGDFLGVTGLGKSLAQGIFLRFTPEGKDVLSRIGKGEMKFDDLKGILGEEVTPKQVGASVAETALTTATLGAGKALKGISSLKDIGRTAAGFGAAGAGFGAAKAFGEEKRPEEIAKQAAVSGTASALFGGAIKGAGLLAGSFLGGLPERIYNTAVKPSLDDLRKSVKFGGKTLGQELIERGVSGTDKQLLQRAQEELVKNENKLERFLSQSKETITREELAPFVKELAERKAATPGAIQEVETITNVLQQFPESVDLKTANQIKRNIYKELRDTAYRLDPNLSGKKEAMKKLASGLRKLIEDKTPGVDVKSINKNLQVFLELEEGVIDKFARANRNNLLSLSDVLPAALGGLGGGVIGAGVGIGLKKVVGTSYAKTTAAVTLNEIRKGLQKLPVDTAGKVSKVGILKIIRDVLSP